MKIKEEDGFAILLFLFRNRPYAMNLFANILWLLLGGLVLGLVYILAGLFWCVTIVGIPFGYQLMKLGVFVLTPFGHEPTFAEPQLGLLNAILNIIWIVCGGIELTLAHLVVGVVLCITVVGIPFGLQHFKMAKYALLPFGQFGS